MKIERPKRLPRSIDLPDKIDVNDLTQASKEILEWFGLDSPNLLNVYACALEDALIEQVRNRTKDIEEIKRLKALLSEYEIN